MSGILQGKRIVVPVTARRSFAERLSAAGAIVFPVTFISIDVTSHPQELARATQEWASGGFEWAVFTSQNAVEAVARELATQGVSPSDIAGFRIAAVGEATGRACREAGWPVSLIPQVATAVGLVTEFPEPAAQGRVFAPLGNLASQALERGLAKKGWMVQRVEAYQTTTGSGLSEEALAALAADTIDAVVLTSGSVAAEYARLAPVNNAAIVTIGPTTEAIARHHGLVPSLMAAEPTYDAVEQALVEVLGSRLTPNSGGVSHD